MKLSKFAYLYSKPLGNHTLKIMKKYLEIYFEKKKPGKIMDFCQSEKWEPCPNTRYCILRQRVHMINMIKFNLVELFRIKKKRFYMRNHFHTRCAYAVFHLKQESILVGCVPTVP